MKLTELLEQRAAKVAQMQAIVDSTGGDELTENDAAAFDALKAEERSLQQQIDRMEYLRSIERAAPADHVQSGNDFERLKRSVSVTNIIRAQMNHQPLTGAEAEYNAEMQRRSGKKAEGAFIPFDALETRVNTTQTAPQLVGKDVRAGDYISPLRSSNIVRNMGVRTLTNLSGDVVIPKAGSGMTLGWVAENEPVPESDMTFSNVTLTPKHTGGKTELSRQLLQQASPDVEQLVRDELSYLIAQNIDRAIINGKGGKEPTGILNTPGILEAATPASWLAMLGLIQQLEDNNVENLKILSASGVKTTLAGLEKVAGSGSGFIYENGKVAELPFYTSANVPAGQMIIGDWSQVLLGVWSAIDILVNPYAEPAYSRGGVQIRAMATVDVAVRHPEAFLVAGAE